MRDRPPCRRVLIGATLAAAALAGCGFQLRRPPELQLKRVALTGLDAYSPMGEELRRQLRASPGAVVVEAPAQADMVLAVLEDAREQVVVASTAAALSPPARPGRARWPAARWTPTTAGWR